MKQEMHVDLVDIETLIPDPNNANTHDDKNLSSIRGSIKQFGIVEPLVVRKQNNVVIGGNGRLTVLKQLGYKEIPVHYVDVDDQKAKALGIALNRTSELSTWDMDILGVQLQELREFGFDIGEIGFDIDDFKTSDFEPVSEEDQGKLDEKKKIICPACDHEFTT